MQQVRERVAVLSFDIAGQSYGLPVRWIQEVVPYATLLPGPRGLRHVCGVLDLRGQAVQIVDLRPCLGVPARPPDLQSAIVVLAREYAHMGLLVDSAEEVLELDPDSATEATTPNATKLLQIEALALRQDATGLERSDTRGPLARGALR